MSPSANAAAWQPTLKPRRTRGALKAFAAALGALVIAQYLAGYAFLWSIKTDPRGATPLTILRYGYYYGDRADIRRRIVVTSALGLGAVLACTLFVFLPRRRSLHGDARFATRREIQVAGLLRSEEHTSELQSPCNL